MHFVCTRPSHHTHPNTSSIAGSQQITQSSSLGFLLSLFGGEVAPCLRVDIVPISAHRQIKGKLERIRHAHKQQFQLQTIAGTVREPVTTVQQSLLS